jgi:hypothetical protein
VGTVCGDVAETLVLDASDSYGSRGFGYDQMFFKWHYSYYSVENRTFTAWRSLGYLKPDFDSSFGTTERRNDTFTFEAQALLPNVEYRFAVRVLRFAPWRLNGDLSSTATAPIGSDISAAVVSVVRKTGSHMQVSLKAPPLVIRATATIVVASVSICDPGIGVTAPVATRTLQQTGGSLAYRWRQKAGPTLFGADLESITLDENRLHIPPFLLKTGESYEFELTVTATQRPLTPAVAVVVLYVRHTPPVAVIAGPQVIQPFKNDFLQLDASPSFDPSYPDGDSTATLDFFWQFPSVSYKTPLTPECQSLHDNLIFTWQQVMRERAILNISEFAALFCVGIQYDFEVLVSHPCADDNVDIAACKALQRGSTTMSLITRADLPMPIFDGTPQHAISVSLAHVDNDRYTLNAFPFAAPLRLQASVSHNISYYDSELTASAGDSVTLVATPRLRAQSTRVYNGTTAVNGMSLRYTWKESSTLIDLSVDTLLTAPLCAPVLALRGGAMRFFNRPSTTTAAARPVRITLFVELVDADGNVITTANSLVSVALTREPTTPTATLTPLTGIAGVTVFTATCGGALAGVDDVSPLSYAFDFIRASVDGISEPQPLTARSSARVVTLILPPGRISVLCVAFDKNGVRSEPSLFSAQATVATGQNLVTVGSGDAVDVITPDNAAVIVAAAALEQRPTADIIAQLSAFWANYAATAVAGNTLDCSVLTGFLSPIYGLLPFSAARGELRGHALEMTANLVATLASQAAVGNCPDSFRVAVAAVDRLLLALRASSQKNVDLAPTPLIATSLSSMATNRTLATLAGAVSALVGSSTAAAASVDVNDVDAAAVCARFANATALVDTFLSVSATRALPGETTQGIDTAVVTATAVRVGTDSATAGAALATAGVDVALPAGVLTAPELGGCAIVHVVDYNGAGARACFAGSAAALSASDLKLRLTPSTSLGLDKSISDVVAASVFQCDGTPVEASVLSNALNATAAAVSFVVPLDSVAALDPASVVKLCAQPTRYLPNDREVTSQQQQLTKTPVCSFWDTDTADWSSAGCKVVSVAADITCECPVLADFSIVVREETVTNVSACNLSADDVFGNLVYLFVATFYAVVCFSAMRLSLAASAGFGGTGGGGVNALAVVQLLLVAVAAAMRSVLCALYYVLVNAAARDVVSWEAAHLFAAAAAAAALLLAATQVLLWARPYYSAAVRQWSINGASAYSDNQLAVLRPRLLGAGGAAAASLLVAAVAAAVVDDRLIREVIAIVSATVYTACVLPLLAATVTLVRVGLSHLRNGGFARRTRARWAALAAPASFALLFVGIVWLLLAAVPVAYFENFDAVNASVFTVDAVALLLMQVVWLRRARLAAAAAATYTLEHQPTPTQTVPDSLRGLLHPDDKAAAAVKAEAARENRLTGAERAKTLSKRTRGSKKKSVFGYKQKMFARRSTMKLERTLTKERDEEFLNPASTPGMQALSRWRVMRQWQLMWIARVHRKLLGKSTGDRITR